MGRDGRQRRAMAPDRDLQFSLQGGQNGLILVLRQDLACPRLGDHVHEIDGVGAPQVFDDGNVGPAVDAIDGRRKCPRHGRPSRIRSPPLISGLLPPLQTGLRPANLGQGEADEDAGRQGQRQEDHLGDADLP